MRLAKNSTNYSFLDQEQYMQDIQSEIQLNTEVIANIKKEGRFLAQKIQNDTSFSIEKFFQEYSLSGEEGIAIMCLAESILRVPDSKVAFELACDKLEGKNWSSPKGHNMLIKFASLGLNFSSKFLNITKPQNLITSLISKLSGPIFVSALKQAIKLFSNEFILSNTVEKALQKTKKYPQYTFSFDLLGESARNFTQSNLYYQRYLEAIDLISNFDSDEGSASIFQRPNLSVKFTSLYPRFELVKYEDIKEFLLPKLETLVTKAKANSISISFDAEEAARLDIYMLIMHDLIKRVKDFEGIGFVVQAYQKRAKSILEEILKLSISTGKQIPVRLVKGAYWDSEIKHAQELGLEDYPVFTKKDYTDANYIYCTRFIAKHNNNFYPQFGTHNALTTAYVLEIMKGKDFEFQKLFGMGNLLHQELLSKNQKVRIYAPIGDTNDLLAYLMRRMLENGANSSFINKIYDLNIKASDLIYDISEKITKISKSPITLPQNLYPDRINSSGYDLGYKSQMQLLQENILSFNKKQYQAKSIINGKEIRGDVIVVKSPSNSSYQLGGKSFCSSKDMARALQAAKVGIEQWSKNSTRHRGEILEKIANLYETNQYELLSLLIREAGKSIDDAVAEVREAIDFCRYYAVQAQKIMAPIEMPSPTGEKNILTLHPKGIFVCISPWNFPLAIFTGQIVAALVTGNSVLAKPAEQTSLIAYFAVKLMHQAGIPKEVLHLIIAPGREIGKYIISSEEISGVTFTGSTATARMINMALAERHSSIATLIAETGGQNAMIVDSSALLEQVCDDVINSSFYSAGQRCSALRILYIQEEIFDPLVKMITDAISTLNVGNTIDFANDIGPVINEQAKESLQKHIDYMRGKGYKVSDAAPQKICNAGSFLAPHIIEVESINDIPDENFGPILHIARFSINAFDKIIDEINNYGYGLTFGIHSRIEERIEYLRSKIEAGNLYANRSTTGAVVGTHPFGGEKKSGTGFKAGGPHYLLKFLNERTSSINLTAIGGNIELLRLSGE